MGSSHWPLSTEAWERNVHALGDARWRGGLRSIASGLLPEESLVVPPARRRLALPSACRDSCNRKHRGFCTARDRDIIERYSTCIAHLKSQETAQAAGEAVFRFYAGGGDPACRDKGHDMHFSFAVLRQRPKYMAIYLRGVAEDPHREVDLPFRLSDEISRVGQMPRPGDPAPDQKSMIAVRSWQLAVLLCRRFTHGPVVMERLEHTVTPHLKTIVVTGVGMRCDDILEPPVANAMPPARHRRGIDVLRRFGRGHNGSGVGGGSSSSAGPGVGPCRIDGGAVDSSDSRGAGDAADTWWVQSLKTMGRPGARCAVPTASDEEGSDKDIEDAYLKEVELYKTNANFDR